MRHAGATRATVTLELDDTTATLVVADDGVGIADGDRERSLAGGHIGLHSQALRIGAAGGTLASSPAGRARSPRSSCPSPTTAADDHAWAIGRTTMER